MADKLTQQITDALSRAAAEPTGLPLYAAKTDPGLFPSSAAAKPAAQKCLADGLLRVVGTDAKGKTSRELYALTDAGWDFLLAAVNPRQVLEDFVRVLEARQGEVGELLDTARRMADSLQGLKDAAARMLPQVTLSRVQMPAPASRERERPELGCTPVAHAPGSPVNIAAAILARLNGWSESANAGEDCPLPELFHALSARDSAPSIGEFHDCLRALHAEGAVYLHPWTGPLYALPEPQFALLAGHNVAYYASLREAGVRSRESGVGETPASAFAGSL